MVLGRIFQKVFQKKNYLEINIHDNFSTVNAVVAVLIYLVEFLNSMVRVTKVSKYPAELF